jgi:chemotaxis protein MotB
MAKKKKHPEHVNLERYLISYADFITLLFATFVVLYALSQTDVNAFKSLQDSIKQAFAAPSVMQGSQGLMSDSSDSIFTTSQADSMIAPLMMEYTSQRYEDQAMQDIVKDINQETKNGDISDVEAEITDRGIVIRLQGNYLFKAGSAELTPAAKIKLEKVGAVIAKKFILHNIRIEGHTDNQPQNTVMYPSNWELSSARSSSIIRFFIAQFGFMPSIFTAVGFADTRPLVSNKSESGQAKNRRVELLILKNRFKSNESATNDIMQMNKDAQKEMQNKRIAAINRIEALLKKSAHLTEADKKVEENAVVLNKVYDKEVKRLFRETQALDSNDRSKLTGQGTWLKPPAKKVSDTSN